ncbi:MAG: CPBP family intramembrane metalloprotease [Bradymonadales bacterium]|nr:CPBP family intramembrane metalloprotease [Bradymonadales bacterium]
MGGGRRKNEGIIRAAWRRLITESIERSEQDSLKHMTRRSSSFDGKVVVVCVVAAVNLAVLNYFGMSNRIGWAVQQVSGLLGWVGWPEGGVRLVDWLLEGSRSRLCGLFFWAASCVTMYFVVPALVIKLGFRQSLGEYGLKLRGGLRHLKIYLVLFAIVLPAVVVVSFSENFQEQYPFYQDYRANRIPAGFLYWELAYAVQFFALEFFFRGFLVHGLKHRLGFYSVLVMVVPYCMIHFGKPFPETLASIVAGLVLGLLSLRTGTIWPGFLIHVSVAWSMDLAALVQKGLLF